MKMLESTVNGKDFTTQSRVSGARGSRNLGENGEWKAQEYVLTGNISRFIQLNSLDRASHIVIDENRSFSPPLLFSSTQSIPVNKAESSKYPL